MLFSRISSVTIKGDTSQVTLEGLRMIFNITKDNSPSHNKFDVSIYNLSQTTISKIQDRDSLVTLSAGYDHDSGLEVIAIGNITRTIHTYGRPEVISRIECGDGLEALREARSNISNRKGVTVETIINQLASDMGVAIKEITTEIKEAFTNGFSFIGPTKKALDSIANAYDLEWSIQDGELQIIQRGKINGERKIFLSTSTGLLKSPEFLVSDSQILSSIKNDKPRYRLEALLNPKFIPGGQVEVESNLVRGNFRINSVNHIGDTHGSSWVSTLEVTQI